MVRGQDKGCRMSDQVVGIFLEAREMDGVCMTGRTGQGFQLVQQLTFAQDDQLGRRHLGLDRRESPDQVPLAFLGIHPAHGDQGGLSENGLEFRLQYLGSLLGQKLQVVSIIEYLDLFTWDLEMVDQILADII